MSTVGVRAIFIEPDHSLVVAPNPLHLTEDGVVVHSFDQDTSFIAMSQPFSPDHTVVWSGAVGLVLVGNNLGKSQLRRWEPSGRCDDRFQCNFNNAKVETMSLLPDGGILVSRLLRTLPPPGGARRLVRIGPDSDMKLLDPRIVGGISRSV